MKKTFKFLPSVIKEHQIFLKANMSNEDMNHGRIALHEICYYISFTWSVYFCFKKLFILVMDIKVTKRTTAT